MSGGAGRLWHGAEAIALGGVVLYGRGAELIRRLMSIDLEAPGDEVGLELRSAGSLDFGQKHLRILGGALLR